MEFYKQGKRRWEVKRTGSTTIRGKGQGIVNMSIAGNAPSESCAVKQQGHTWRVTEGKQYDSWHIGRDFRNCSVHSGRVNLYLHINNPSHCRPDDNTKSHSQQVNDELTKLRLAGHANVIYSDLEGKKKTEGNWCERRLQSKSAAAAAAVHWFCIVSKINYLIVKGYNILFFPFSSTPSFHSIMENL